MNIFENFNELPDALVGLITFLLSMIPYVESYIGAPLGIVGGLPAALAIAIAILGNILSMLGFVFLGQKLQSKRASKKEPSKRQEKLRERFDRYGVIPVSLFGQVLLPSQITAGAMVTFGVTRRKVILWQCISIVLWGAGFGLAAAGVFSLVS